MIVAWTADLAGVADFFAAAFLAVVTGMRFLAGLGLACP